MKHLHRNLEALAEELGWNLQRHHLAKANPQSSEWLRGYLYGQIALCRRLLQRYHTIHRHRRGRFSPSEVRTIRAALAHGRASANKHPL